MHITYGETVDLGTDPASAGCDTFGEGSLAPATTARRYRSSNQ